MISRTVARWAGVVAAVFGLVAAATVPAWAYGTDHLYEVTLSYNCQNPTLCVASQSNPFGIGGIWGWLEPDTGASADGQVQFQGHNNTDPSLNGTGHTVGINGYQLITCPNAQNPLCGLAAQEGTPTDPNGNYFVFFANFGPQLGVFPIITPATPGHYGNHPAPGIVTNANVVQLH